MHSETPSFVCVCCFHGFVETGGTLLYMYKTCTGKEEAGGLHQSHV